MQTDARLIQYVEHSREARADLGRQPNPLGFATAEGHGGSIQAQIIEPHIQQKLQTQPYLSQHQITDLDLARTEQRISTLALAHPHQRLNPAQGFAHTHRREFVDGIGAHPHRQRFGP